MDVKYVTGEGEQTQNGAAQENQKQKERSTNDRPFPNQMSFLVVYFLKNICRSAFSVYTPWG